MYLNILGFVLLSSVLLHIKTKVYSTLNYFKFSNFQLVNCNTNKTLQTILPSFKYTLMNFILRWYEYLNLLNYIFY